MLKLQNITKTYAEKSDSSVKALKGISLNFRPCEFVSILGPSGCGKTTLLNIIGGLDRYTDGDLVINGKSTKEYGDRDWDTYRNHSIGFVFQSYNLIPHQTILENVELTMTLGGVPKEERKKRAKEALISVGLGDKLSKRPNQLSGGQMQRVSIARALVGDPDIILADEPTGALDSETGVMVMELLKEISKTKLVIMVTHNPDLADRYSDRIIKMLDGVVIEDSNPCSDEEEAKSVAKKKESAETGLTYKKKHSSMSIWTALKLSARNLLSKKRRTIITSLAASIGLIGMAIILSVSNGMQAYIDQTMLDSTSFNYITISSETMSMPDFSTQGGTATEMEEFPENTTGIYPYKQQTGETKKQNLSDEYLAYLKEKTDGLVVDLAYTYSVNLNILTKNGDKYVSVDSSNWGESLNNYEYISNYYTVLSQADGISSAIPSSATEVAIVVDNYNRLSTTVLDALGIEYTENEDGSYSEIKYEDLLGKEFRVVYNDGWYTPTDMNGTTIYQAANATNYESAYSNENGITVKVVSVLRQNEDASASWLSNGIAYSPELTKAVLAANKDSAVVTAQLANEEIDVTTGNALADEDSAAGGFPMMGGGASVTHSDMLETLGYVQTPASITIYPVDTASRETIVGYLDEWNTNHEGTGDEVEYTDMSSMMTSMLGTIVDIVTYVLMAFSITSLVISSIMIAIIIYASVIERIKEIGVLRSIGARKKDISHVFEAEAVILGFVSGVIAIGITLLANIGINAILKNLVGVSTIASLAPLTAIGLVVLSMVLLLIASLIPAKMAAKKEPAVALRSE